MFMTYAITRSGMATASSGVFHQMYLLASGFNDSGLIWIMVVSLQHAAVEARGVYRTS